jgi:hypothetical protein
MASSARHGLEVDEERPVRRAVATFDNYAEAQAAVDRLSDQRFPIERVAIVAQGLRLEEQVTGRVTVGRAALRGAAGGAFTGALIGWLLGLLNAVEPLVSALGLAIYGLILGAILGGTLGAVTHFATRGRRDFAAVSTIRADYYDVLVDEPVASAAEDLLAR